MPTAGEGYEWRPGSFTKNFSWGSPKAGLAELHAAIRVGFANELRDVERSLFRRRMELANRIDFIPINFFLFNRIVNGTDYIIVDELVFQAIKNEHSERFDKLALFTLNLSFSGEWVGAEKHQRRPSLWASNYILQRINPKKWNTSEISADDVQDFLDSSSLYTGKTSRKVATNLSYLYKIGNIASFANSQIDRAWVDCVFLALDRIIEDRKIDGFETKPMEYSALLDDNFFFQLSGKDHLARRLAAKHLIRLYEACGGRSRFDEEATKTKTLLSLPEIAWLIANDDRPRGAVHPSNPKILKSIPRACAVLARSAGFDDLSPDDLEDFDIEAYVRKKVLESIKSLDGENISARIDAERLTKLTRGE